ncbi:MAG: hypothetical protein AAF738_07950, partial [Bacteroidota bacterium]
NLNLGSTKFAVIFHLLSNKEIKNVKKYLASPFFSNRTVLSSCFGYILSYQQQHKTLPDRWTLFQEIFPDANEYDDQKLRLLLSQLVGAIEDYWVYQLQMENVQARRIVLASIYRKKKQEKFFQKSLHTARKSLEKSPYRSEQFYTEQYRIELEAYRHIGAGSRSNTLNLQVISDALDHGFIIAKLLQACRTLSKQAVSEEAHDFGLLPYVLQYVEQQNLLQASPAIAAYYYCYQALLGKQGMQKNFEQFKAVLFSAEHLFPPEELHDLYLLAINCCIRLINSGQADFLYEILGIYKRGLENGAVLEHGVLSRFTCQNIVTAGLRTGEYTWTRDFLERYRPQLEKGYRTSAYRFNLGRIAYSEKNYDEALQLLRDTDHKDLLVHLFSKTLLLKIYYELAEFQLLDSFLDAFAIYLRRKKVVGEYQTNYKNVIAYTKKLITINPFNQAEKDALAEQLKQEQILSERAWLLAQLAAL